MGRRNFRGDHQHDNNHGIGQGSTHQGVAPGKLPTTTRIAATSRLLARAHDPANTSNAAQLPAKSSSAPESASTGKKPVLARESAGSVQRKSATSAAPGSSGYWQEFYGDLGAQEHQGATTGDVQAVAAAGVAGSGGALPHLGAIQKSFGRHQVGSIQAHVGGRAGDAATAIGASAYATGNDVAFASSPDLHTAAHEAAHVIQQRSGVSLLGGVGQSGDAYEQHADAVADLVVQGKSAEGLLSQMAGGSGGANAVQRKKNKDKTPGANVNHVGGIAEDAQPLARDRVKDHKEFIWPGKTHYTGTLIAQSDALAGPKLAAGTELGDSIPSQITPQAGDLDEQRKNTASAKADLDAKLEDGSPVTRSMLGKYKSYFDPALSRLVEMRDGFTSRVGQYNAWIPSTQLYYGSFGRLLAQMDALGIPDSDELVLALREGLEDAKEVAEAAMDSEVEEGDSKVQLPKLAKPETGRVTGAVKRVSDAASALQAANVGMRTHFKLQMISGLELEEDEQNQAMAKIEAAKKLLRKAGSVIDVGFGKLFKPKTYASIGSNIEKGEGIIGKAGATRDGAADIGGELSKLNEKVPEVPKSFEDLAGLAGDLIYADEVKGIRRELNRVRSEIEPLRKYCAVDQLLQFRLEYETALQKFVTAHIELHRSLIAQRDSYLKLGQRLDSFAKLHKPTKNKALAANKGEERYTTILGLAAQSSEVVAMGNSAFAFTSGDLLPTLLRSWESRMLKDDMGDRPAGVPRVGFGDASGQITEMYNYISKFRDSYADVVPTLGPVEKARSELAAMLTTSTGGKDSGAY